MREKKRKGKMENLFEEKENGKRPTAIMPSNQLPLRRRKNEITRRGRDKRLSLNILLKTERRKKIMRSTKTRKFVNSLERGPSCCEIREKERSRRIPRKI